MKNQTLNKKIGLRRTVFCLLTIFCFCDFMKAQDKITMKDGTEIICKVTEIGDYEIKYSYSDVFHSVLKKDVFMITYANGDKEVIKSTPAPRVLPVYVTQQKPAPSITDKYDSDTSDFAKIKQKKFSGPRVGYAYIGHGINTKYMEMGGKRPSTVQIGWQFETVLFSVDHTQGIVEVVPLIGGFEQGLFLPSLSILLGLRGGTKTSFEVALGPNFSIGRDYFGNQKGRVGLVLAVGTSLKKKNINFPITLAFVPSVGYTANVYDASTATSSTVKYESGYRVALLVGFNSRKR